jgi:hypothetical protein
MKITKSILKTMIKKELNLLNEADYTVQVGDSISKIADNEEISVSAILSANSDKFDKTKVSNWRRGDRPGPLDTTSNTAGTRNPNWIYPGEIIKLPFSSPAREPVGTGPGRDTTDDIVLPSTGDIEAVVGTETADEYREDCKDSILAVLNALITTIDSMKERVSKSE